MIKTYCEKCGGPLEVTMIDVIRSQLDGQISINVSTGCANHVCSGNSDIVIYNCPLQDIIRDTKSDSVLLNRVNLSEISLMKNALDVMTKIHVDEYKQGKNHAISI